MPLLPEAASCTRIYRQSRPCRWWCQYKDLKWWGAWRNWEGAPVPWVEWASTRNQWGGRVVRAHSGRNSKELQVLEWPAARVSSGSSWVCRSSRRLPVFTGKCFTNILCADHNDPWRHEPYLVFPSVARTDVDTGTWLAYLFRPSYATGRPQRWSYKRQPQWSQMSTAFQWSYRRF